MCTKLGGRQGGQPQAPLPIQLQQAIVMKPQAGSMDDADQAHAPAQQLGIQQLLRRPIEGAGDFIEHHEAG